jgi:hypothetical protein
MTTTSTDTAGIDPPSSAEIAVPLTEQTHRSRLRGLAQRAQTSLRDEALLLAVLAGAFISRWLIADRNSYWLDELYSVAIYGVWNESASAAVQRLADTSVHPPMYQFILYNWMEWFGDAERATRTLSNVYITLATLFLYLLVRDSISRRVGLASAVVFALMYSSTYYALEARSYAQTIFLVTLSSYALLRMMRTGAARGWVPAIISPPTLAFTFANVALLLTHYYNFFFWIAQGIVAGLFVLRERAPRRWFTGISTVAVLYGVQGAIFGLAWGRVLLDDYRRRGDAFPVDGSVRSPLDLLSTVITPNIDPPPVVRWLGIAVFLVVTVRALVSLIRGGELTVERQRAWSVAYLISWLLVPLLVVYVAFVITGVARYSPRYWLFIVPPMAPLIVLVIDETVDLVSRLWRRMRGVALGVGWATVLTVLVIGALILPGTLGSATREKTDWRGTAQDIVDIIESDAESSYVIYETSFRSTPVLDYYLSRYSNDIRVTATIRRSEERAGENFSFERTADVIEQHDYLIVPFIHHRTTDFPTAMERLSATYDVHHRQIRSSGKGLVIFAVTSADD